MAEHTLLDDALIRLDEAAAHLSIDPDVIEKLKYARETTKVRLMIRMDDGSRKSFLAWRSAEAWTIGKAISSGCVRLLHQDVIHLYDNVRSGSPIVVLAADGVTSGLV